MGRYWQSTETIGYKSTVIYCICIMVIITLFVSVTYARDFGVIGHTYDIREQDILEYIKEKLQKVDIDALNKEMREKIKENVERPKAVANITNAIEDKEYYYDPTFVLEEAIYDHNGTLIHPKGTIINPLAKVPLASAMIFINGDKAKQVEYALKEYKSLNEKAKIILTKGAPIELQKHHKVWIYFDQFGFLTTKLGIEHVPAIVKQDGLKFKINEIALK